MHYDFKAPPDWTVTRLPRGDRSLVLRAPAGEDSAERAALFLLDPLVPVGTLGEQLAQAVEKSLQGLAVLKQEAPQPLPALADSALLVPVRVRVKVQVGGELETQEEGRLYIMIELGADRLLVVFTGGPNALPLYQPALESFLRSIRPTEKAASRSPFSSFED